jgi:hypothetical protein
VVLLLLGAALFTVGGVSMIGSGRTDGWFVAGFFGLCTAVFVAQLGLPGSLTLTKTGFTIRNLGRSTSIAWSDVAAFGLMQHRPFGSKMAAFQYTRLHRDHHPMTRLSRSISGFDGALPETYGYKAEDLVALLEQWRSGDRQ